MKWLENPEKLREILFELVACPSFSGSEKELDMAKKVYSIVSEIPYFRDNPGYLKLNEIENDKFNRCFVTALLKGKGDKTVVLLHHHDVVDVDDYGALKNDAFDPEKITKMLREADMPEEARKDMETGEWLFGRGVMDMKAGAALQIALLHDFSEIKDFEGNILLLSVPGEESNSEGMLAAVPFLNKLKDRYGLDYVAVVNSEPSGNRVVTGSIGKLLPVFYCFGKETHASRPFEGLSSSMLFSQVTALMDDNVELCDQAEGETSSPSTNLKVKDLKLRYNVTTPQVTAGYFNVFSMQRPADEILDILKKIACRAFENTLKIKRENARKFAELSGGEPPQVPWKPNVYSYEQLYDVCRKTRGKAFEEHIKSYIERLTEEEKDEREFTIKLIDEVHSFCPDREPKIVIAFAPPYYPHIINKGITEKERYMLEVVDRLIEYGKKEFNVEMGVIKIYPGITDLSYCGLQDADNVVKHLKPNMPAIGHIYSLPVEEMGKLDLAVINVGPAGRDAHKFTERLHMPYFEKTAPFLLKFAVEELLKF